MKRDANVPQSITKPATQARVVSTNNVPARDIRPIAPELGALFGARRTPEEFDIILGRYAKLRKPVV